ncbi:cupin domain-containing protein [Halobacillus sp. K22]|uniref:cupin domain-containing protein n=1 Tax=Halobacillus sp. K22 TaxID=3457431 RepID=UPI003FCCE307
MLEIEQIYYKNYLYKNILQGKLTIVLGKEEGHFEEGDSISFNSMRPHRYINPTNEKAITVWAMTPPSF